jgi:hypothetical protein
LLVTIRDNIFVDCHVEEFTDMHTNPVWKWIKITERVGVKGKAIPLQALTGPEGSRRLRLPDFKTIGT